MATTVMELMTQIWTAIGGIMVAYTMFKNYLPPELIRPIQRYSEKLISLFYPYIHITFPEYTGNGFERSGAFSAIERYLNATATLQATRLRANFLRDISAVILTMDKYQEVTDEFSGVKLWWASRETPPTGKSISIYPREEGKKFFRLTFHRSHRDLITTRYVTHVLAEGKAITIKERRRKLFTNNKNDGGGYSYYRRSMWSEVAFEHPATFDTLAMDPTEKKAIVDDLIRFTESKDYYSKVGKAWKRGYLLYGPPGTGKSTMIAAMANLLKYDVYDLELTAVKDNTELRKLLIDTSNKSLIVIEDIDCSLDLTGQREEKKEKEKGGNDKEKDEVSELKKKLKKMEENKSSQVTLSGLLNFIDGLWSACGGERVIVFTTNYVEKLDPALIRRGRMDKKIELSYCGFEAFKVLAKNYLDVESHDLFGEIKRRLEETNMTPADVAENLMPKSGEDDEEDCLKRLIEAIEEAKEEARKKEEKEKAEKLAKEEEEKKKSAKEEEKKEDKENGVVSEGGDQNLSNGGKENGEDIKAN